MLRVVALLAALAVASCSSHEGHDMMGGGMDVTFNNYASGGPMMGGMMGGMGMKGMGGLDYYKDWEDWMEYWGDDDDEEDMTMKKKMRTLDSHEDDDEEDYDEMKMMKMMYGSGPLHYYYFISHMMEECHEHVHEAVHELHMHNMASMVGMFCDLYFAACDGVGTAGVFSSDATTTDDDLVTGRFDTEETCMETKMGIMKWATADWDHVGECMGESLMDAIALGNGARTDECEMAAAAGDCTPTHMYPEWDMEDMEDMMMM